MKKTMLTYKTLDRFEDEYKTEQYTAAELEKIEFAAYVANMNASQHGDWSEDDIYNEFFRVLGVDHIETETKEPTAAEIVERIAAEVEQTKTRSAWDRGVKAYAEELVDELRVAVDGGYVDADELSNRRLFEKAMLNGAADWRQYSEGGCALCYDGKIAARLCAPWELRKTDNGRKDPNPRESWIDVQSRALYQAAQIVLNAAF